MEQCRIPQKKLSVFMPIDVVCTLPFLENNFSDTLEHIKETHLVEVRFIKIIK